MLSLLLGLEEMDEGPLIMLIIIFVLCFPFLESRCEMMFVGVYHSVDSERFVGKCCNNCIHCYVCIPNEYTNSDYGKLVEEEVVIHFDLASKLQKLELTPTEDAMLQAILLLRPGESVHKKLGLNFSKLNLLHSLSTARLLPLACPVNNRVPCYNLCVHIMASPWYNLCVHIMASPWYNLCVHFMASPWYNLCVHIMVSPWYNLCVHIMVSP